ncbi:MAG: cation:proton antiporter subunit C [Planctomycetota bacterium]|jgi:multicomponent Na+:H+ antiporter subunit C
MLDFLVKHYNYVVYILLMVIGLYAMLARGNLVKKIIGLTLLQTAVFLFYISIGKVESGTVPVIWPAAERPEGMATAPYENPLPHVLMLTAIVVGVGVTAVALALIVRIKAAYGCIEEEDILAADEEREEAG